MDMKKILSMLFMLLALIAFSASAFAEVSGNTFAVERTDKSKLKIKKGLNEKDTEVVQIPGRLTATAPFIRTILKAHGVR